jgi:hypothetical protein
LVVGLDGIVGQSFKAGVMLTDFHMSWAVTESSNTIKSSVNNTRSGLATGSGAESE